MSYIYEDAIDFLEERSQMYFIQESIQAIGINEGFNPKESINKIWEKIKAGFNFIRRKIKEMIDWIKNKFKKKDQEVKNIVKEVESKAKNPEKVAQATTALAVIAKPSDSTSTGSQVPATSKVNGLSAAGGKFTYEKLNDSSVDKLGKILFQASKGMVEINDNLNADTIGQMAVYVANNPDEFTKNKMADNIKDIEEYKAGFENALSSLVTKISIDKVDVGVTRDIYNSYLRCSKEMDDWAEISGEYEKTINSLTNKCDKITKTITSHATSSDSNDNEREVLKNLQSGFTMLNKVVRMTYDYTIKCFNSINSVKNSNYAALFMIYRAYRKGEGSSNQGNQNGSSYGGRQSNNPRLGTTAVATR